MGTRAAARKASPQGPAWKDNWAQARQHFTQWWERRGMVLQICGGGSVKPRSDTPNPGAAASDHDLYCNPQWCAQTNLYNLAHDPLWGDSLPIAAANVGPGSLALCIGSEPTFTPETVWFNPRPEQPEDYPALRFDPANRWFKVQEALLRECVRAGQGRFIVGCPDLIENIDILVSLRGMENLLADLLDRPEWVEKKVAEINQVFFDVYSRLYDIIKLPDGSSAWGAFWIWGPGKTAKVQCDASAAFSPAMFKRFVVPALAQQCEWLDHSLYHLDGTQAVCHLDLLLEIKALDAIEWTPQAGRPGGGSPCWYDLYKRILKGGKGVQIIGVKPDEVVPLLDTLGSKGVFMVVNCGTPEEAERTVAAAEKYRK